MPYVVLTVQLAEGPRMFGRLLGNGTPRIGAPANLAIEEWPDGRCVAAFELADADAKTERTIGR